MLELTIYGLMGLTVLLLVAFYFAFEDEFSLHEEIPLWARKLVSGRRLVRPVRRGKYLVNVRRNIYRN
jgi:hypothetical protein